VLFGQPELNRKLELESIRQLAQRITFHYHLGPLSRDDLDFYVAHRLRVAGFAGARLFSSAAIARLYKASGGVPRLVNVLAHKALMLCYGEGGHAVSRAHVNAAARDTLATSARAGDGRRMLPWAAAGALLAGAAASVAWAFTR
jgi:MSHA biogenesis protein MshM